MANSKEIQKRINLLYEEASIQKGIYEADNRRTTALKESQKAVDQILKLEKELNTPLVQQNKAIKDSQSLQKKINDDLKKKKGFLDDMFGMENKSKKVNRDAAEQIEQQVAGNADLSEEGSKQLQHLNDINQGYMSQNALTSLQADLEKEIAEDTGEGADARNDMRNATLDSVKQQLKLTDATGKMKKGIQDSAKSMVKTVAAMVSAGAAIAFLQKALQKANEIAGSVGKEFGALGMNSGNFQERVSKSSEDMVAIGLSATDLNSSITMLTSEFGQNINQINEAGEGIEVMAQKIADSGKAMGLSTQEATKLFGTVMKITDLSAEQTENLLEQTASLAMQSGVAPQVVMRDIANSGELFASHMKDGGKNVLEAAIRARQLGLDLNAVAKIGDGLMNFQSSLNAEMEASVMIGRQINLQKARELYLAGDLSGMQDEILKQVGSEQKFNQMNIMEKQALAKAVNMNVQELQKMMSVEEDMAELNGEIEETNPFKELIGEDTMTEIDNLMARLESLSVTIGNQILPVVESFVTFMTDLTNKFDVANIAALALAGTFTMMVGPAIAAATSAVATAMGLSAAAVPVVGWVAAGIAGAAMFAQIKSMMNQAKSIKDGGSMGGGAVMSRPEGNVQLTRGDDFVAGTNLFGDKGGSTAALSPRALKKERREERQLELAERQAKIEEEKLKILKDTADASIGTYRELYQT